MVVTVESLMISPLFKHNFLLSSNTVFMFSIQMASTGPSSTTHCRRPSPKAFMASRTAMASTPSVHSCVLRSLSPYSCPCVMDFGFMTYCVTGNMSSPSANSANVSANTFLTLVLPQGGIPTVMSPCRTSTVSHNWMTFVVNGFVGCRPLFSEMASIVANSLPALLGGSSTPGNKSPMIPLNSGRSAVVNFGKFTSVKDRKAMTSSGY
mmetsp:Transcript_43909/g.102647  ORF Transcript_43909/g.102647 Transcript_43909/m.102647 type:complete len:208 (+) Transcript_43909:539-1162(+)